MVKFLKLNSTQSVSESVTKVGIELLGQLKNIPNTTKHKKANKKTSKFKIGSMIKNSQIIF